MSRFIITELDEVNLQPNATEEILQNVRTIISTIKETVPMYREFGVENILDVPINLAEARLTTAIAESISKYEPRAKLISVEYQHTESEIIPKVVIEIGE